MFVINYYGDVYNKDYRHLRKVIGDNIGTFIFGMIMLTFCFPIGKCAPQEGHFKIFMFSPIVKIFYLYNNSII